MRYYKEWEKWKRNEAADEWIPTPSYYNNWWELNYEIGILESFTRKTFIAKQVHRSINWRARLDAYPWFKGRMKYQKYLRYTAKQRRRPR